MTKGRRKTVEVTPGEKGKTDGKTPGHAARDGKQNGKVLGMDTESNTASIAH